MTSQASGWRRRDAPGVGQEPFWTLPLARVLREVGGSEAGLSSVEAGRRLKRWGPNEVAPPRRVAPWLGFTPLPPLFFAFLIAVVVTYLALVEGVKGWFYRRYLL